MRGDYRVGPVTRRRGEVGMVSFRHRKDYSIAANTSSSDTVANVVAESDIP